MPADTMIDRPVLLLSPEDPPAVTMVGEDGGAASVLICDHASNAVPRALRCLGVADCELLRHIGWDIGAAAVTRGLSGRLAAPALLAGYSRLVIDLNRQPGDPTSMPVVSDGTEIPANRDLSEEQVQARLQELFWPYHHAITEAIGRQWRLSGLPPALIAVHSFTPEMNGRRRPWHVGILWNHDPRLAVPLIQRLRARGDLEVGDNEPYSGRSLAYTTERHAAAAGLPHVGIEIRQDLIGDVAGVARWVEILAEALAPILAEATLHRVEMF
jgi:predicted N-formylglutamate amidohydrolase